MDLGSIIIGLVLAAVWLVPFLIAKRSGNKRKRTLEHGMNRLATENGISITEFEICNNFIIGIDKQKKGLVYFKKSEESERGIVVDLRSVAKCRVETTSHRYKDKSAERSTIDMIELAFEYILKIQPENRLEIYSAVESTQLNSEVQFAEKWAGLANAGMAANHQPKAQPKQVLV